MWEGGRSGRWEGGGGRWEGGEGGLGSSVYMSCQEPTKSK